MSNALAQSATALAQSGVGETEFDFILHANKAAWTDGKGLTMERAMLQRSKLITSVVNAYRNQFAGIYGRKDVLPSEIFAKVENAVDTVISRALGGINENNVLSVRRSFHYNKANHTVTERVTAIAENMLTLKKQLLGITIYVTAAEKRLRELEAKPTPNHDAEKKVRERIMNLGISQAFIQSELKKLEAEQAAAQ